jgi:hypothetical protein
MQVATVDANNHVKLKTISISRDMGATVDCGSGIPPRPHHRQPRRRAADGDEVRSRTSSDGHPLAYKAVWHL